MLDWSDLRHFLAVAREGSTLAAAKALGVSQSTVHRRLAALEASLGHQLVQRHPTGYRLTSLGADMLAYAERVEASVADFERHLASRDTGLAGTVKIECTATAAHRLMNSPLLDKFRARYPELKVEFVLFNRFLDLAKGEIDLAIRQGVPADEALVARKIADVPWAVFASRGYVERHGQPATPADLAGHAVIGFEGSIADLPAASWIQSVAPRATVVARINALAAVLLTVKSGVGLAPLPVPLAAGDSDLVPVIGPLPELTFPFYLVVHRDMRRTPRVRAFFDFINDEAKLVRQALAGTP